MIPIHRKVVRLTAEIEQRTRKPLVIELMPGGKFLRIRTLGSRHWYTVTFKQVWFQGAANRAAELRAEKRERRAQRRRERQGT